jgi:endonuclease YncB( thermonuclease family)
MDALPPFVCEVRHVHDGDGPLHCANGVKVRIAGVQSPDFENSEPCQTGRPGYVCDDRLAAQARAITARLTLHKRLACDQRGRSWARTVMSCLLPDGQRLECAVIAAGAGVRWERYWRAYRLRPCNG